MLMGIIKADVITEVFKPLCVCFSFSLYPDSVGQGCSPQFTGEEPG